MRPSENKPSAKLPNERAAAQAGSARGKGKGKGGAKKPAPKGAAPPRKNKPKNKQQQDDRKKNFPKQPDVSRLTNYVADTLGETSDQARNQIFRTLLYGGVKLGLEALAKAVEIQANGGMMVLDGSRPRTFGGVFFFCARELMTFEQRGRVFYYGQMTAEDRQKQLDACIQVWNDRLAMLEGLLEERGEIRNVRVTLVGRPGKVEIRSDVVVTTMEYAPRSIQLPKGVPPIPETPSVYLIYISAKQWRKVEQYLSKPEDLFVIEGITAFDPQSGMMVIYTTSITTKMAEAAKRAALRAAAGEGQQAAAPPQPAPAPKKPQTQAAAQPGEPTVKSAAFSDLPPHVAQKLNDLYASAAVFRQKLAAIQSRPAGQQFGLEMTQKLLKNVEDEIAALEKRYAR